MNYEVRYDWCGSSHCVMGQVISDWEGKHGSKRIGNYRALIFQMPSHEEHNLVK